MPVQKQFDLPGATLKQLLQMTPKQFFERKGQCRIQRQEYGTGSRRGFQRSRPKYPIWYNELRTVSACPSRKPRYSYIRFYGPPDIKTRCWVWCSCEDFAYRLEWVLAQIGSSSVAPGYANRGVRIINKPPDIKNPQRQPGLCKHLLQAAELALRQTRDLAGEKATQEAERNANQ